MFGWLKSAASVATSVVKSVGKYVLAPVLIISHVASSAGVALFTIPKFIQLLTGLKNPYEHPATLPAAIITVSLNIFINLTARVANMAKQFWPPPARLIDEEKAASPMDVNDDYDTDEEQEPTEAATTCSCCNSAICHYFKGMGISGVSFYFLSNGISLFSGLFSSISRINGAYSLEELIKNIKNSNKDVPDEDWQEYLVFGIGMMFFLGTLYSFLSNNYASINKNSKNFGLAISKREVPCNKNVAKTLLLAAPSAICVPFVAKFATESALTNLERPLIKIFNISINSALIDSAGWISPFSAFFAIFMSQVPSLYRTLNKSKTIYPNERAWEAPAKKGVFFGGILDAIPTTISNFTGYAFVLRAHEAVWHLDWRNPYVIVVGGISAISTAGLNLIFTSWENFNTGTLGYFHACHGEYPYESVPTTEPANNPIHLEKGYSKKNPFMFFDSDNDDPADNDNGIELKRMLSFEEIEVEESVKQKCW